MRTRKNTKKTNKKSTTTILPNGQITRPHSGLEKMARPFLLDRVLGRPPRRPHLVASLAPSDYWSSELQQHRHRVPGGRRRRAETDIQAAGHQCEDELSPWRPHPVSGRARKTDENKARGKGKSKRTRRGAVRWGIFRESGGALECRASLTMLLCGGAVDVLPETTRPDAHLRADMGCKRHDLM